MNIIEIKNLKKYFGNIKAVDDIDFVVKKGQLFSFLGLNGAGKSTTINIICDALEKDSGSVFVDGKDIDKDAYNIKKELGIVFQNSVLDRMLTVYDNLKLRAGLYGDLKDIDNRIDKLAMLLDFKNLLKRQLGKLSGGQRRRIDIARALIHNPKILILDEPTTGLDPVSRALVWKVITNLIKENGLTVFLTTHYMEEASSSDYVIIIDSGKIVASGTPNDLKNKYANDFMKIYNPSEILKKQMDENKYIYKSGKDYIEITIDNTLLAKKILSQFGDEIEDFEVIKGNMDNVFLTVTGKNLKEE